MESSECALDIEVEEFSNFHDVGFMLGDIIDDLGDPR